MPQGTSSTGAAPGLARLVALAVPARGGPQSGMAEFLRNSDAFAWAMETDASLRSTVVSIVTLDRAPDWDVVVDRTERLSRTVPMFRQRVVESPSPAPPRWEYDPDFDLGYHLRRVTAPGPGTFDTVLEMARRAEMAEFDHARPLWEATLVDGLADGGAALLFKVHHSLTDGIGGVQLAMIMFDQTEEPRDLGLLPPQPAVESPGPWAGIRHVAQYDAQLLGGVARLERIPEEPRQELLIALAGPAVTVAILLALGALVLVSGQAVVLRDPLAPEVPFAARLLVANLLVLGFNLIPAFPLDGGRVLRALLARKLGLVRATRIAGMVGQLFAVALGILGVVAHAPLTMLVAFFIFLGAGTEASAVTARVAGRGLQVSQMMVTNFRTIPIHATLAQAVDLLLTGEQREFPVVDNLGRTEGMLTRDNLIRGLTRGGPTSTVAEAMTPSAPVVSPTLGFQEALDRLRASGLPALPVVDAGGALVGMLTLDNITDLLLVRGAQR